MRAAPSESQSLANCYVEKMSVITALEINTFDGMSQGNRLPLREPNSAQSAQKPLNIITAKSLILRM
jgi:hypothetical protein